MSALLWVVAEKTVGVVAEHAAGAAGRRVAQWIRERAYPPRWSNRVTERFHFSSENARTVRHTMRYDGLTTNERTDTLKLLYHYRVTSTPGRKVKQPLEVIEVDDWHTVRVRWNHDSYNEHEPSTRYEALIEITGGLGPGLPPATFTVAEDMVDAYCDCYEDAVAAYSAGSQWPHEYVCDTNRDATRELVLELFLPQQLNALALIPRPIVFRDPLNEVLHPELTETLRKRRGKWWDYEPAERKAWLKVPGRHYEPRFGYALEWMPPHR